jgi:hypothetical protein
VLIQTGIAHNAQMLLGPSNKIDLGSGLTVEGRSSPRGPGWITHVGTLQARVGRSLVNPQRRGVDRGELEAAAP